MKKYFRFHRMLFDESIATMCEVADIADMKRKIKSELPWVQNIHISRTKYSDSRTPKEWGGTTHYVLADFEGYESQCIGMCNFYEK